jgi:hypothetical protein
MEISFDDWMTNKDEIQRYRKPKHRFSALGLYGAGYAHLKFGEGPIIFTDCPEHRRVLQIWKCSRTALLYNKGQKSDMKN